MKLLLTILMLCSFAYGQDYVSKWTGGIAPYQVQQSIDSVHWNTIITTNLDTSVIHPDYYYRIKSGSNISNVVMVYKVMPVTIVNAYTHNNILGWTSENENNLDYYLIEESTDGINFVETERIPAKGDSIYKIILK